ncbi:hypothetical protein OG361_04850 [Streptomyces sp. NBC_00090]|uniref:hypothetical protein n=1 Tax=Streptomyces sp. NBC_00090 TaxID=2903619 RepID=UPI0032550EE6
MTSRPPDARPYDRGPGGGVPGDRVPGGGAPEDPHALLDRARRLSAAGGHPGAGGAWERAATALRRAGGAITPGDHADALDATALDCRGRAGPAAETLFSRAAELHERAGQHGKALISRARALLAGPTPAATARAELTGHPGHPGLPRHPGLSGPAGHSGHSGHSGLSGLAALCERATALHTTGGATTAQTATVLVLRCRARADLLDTASDPAAEAAALREDLARVVAFAAPRRADPTVLGPLADARALLGRITAPDDPPAALAHLRAAVADHRGSGRPWPPTETELLLAGVLRATGAPEEAATVLRTALGPGEETALLRAADRARICLALARTLTGPGGLGGPGGPGGLRGGEGRGTHGRPRRAAGEEELTLLTEAVHQADRAGEDRRLGLFARLRLCTAHAERGRWQEAAAVTEEILSALTRDGDEAARTPARAWLAYCCLRRGEPDRAAREYALAAAEARLRDDRDDGAALSHRAAHALAVAGAPEKAARAYERAADLWRSVGDHGAAARSLRARARQARTAWGAARAEVILEEALREARRGLRGAAGPGERDRLRTELEEIRRELAELHGPGATVSAVADAVDAVDGGGGSGGGGGGGGESGPGPWLPPDPYGPSGRYQVDVYGEVGGAGSRAATAPRTRVQGCV